MSASVSERIQKRWAACKAAQLHPIQIWVPDIHRPGFAEECRRQARVVAQADTVNHKLQEFMDAALLDIEDE